MKYYLAAAALKAFSATPQTRALYRTLGKNKARNVFDPWARWVLGYVESIGATQEHRFLELGTGWVHAYSLYPALITDAQFDCFDVVDLRRFDQFQQTLTSVAEQIAVAIDFAPDVRARALQRVDALRACSNFEDAYRVLSLTYHISADGKLPHKDATFHGVYAMDVLEHVPRDAFAGAAADWFRVLRPGGLFFTQVGLDDHLSHYDQTRGVKHFLRFSRGVNDALFNSNLLYINHMSSSEIIAALAAAGFEMLHSERELMSSRPATHFDYATQSDEDLRTVRLTLVAKKPT